jgi:hypothetical protein
LRSLADRGLRGVKLVIADDDKGLRAAASKVFHATLQRCRIHWMRNALAHVSTKQRPAVTAMIKTIFAQETSQEAQRQWQTIADALRDRAPKLAEMHIHRHGTRLGRGTTTGRPRPWRWICIGRRTGTSPAQQVADRWHLRYRGADWASSIRLPVLIIYVGQPSWHVPFSMKHAPDIHTGLEFKIENDPRESLQS